ncbi:hypothetical protein HanXRQr2_Chr09g0383571 [Helianthus annuus]|uniref:Uncharacterized protein n=1 Tax=Helianthus annuus TaxID=4232 RepID=A0A251TVB2_HELAN|nr:hypothetical protein HanXRQr2_Chr09g0383571 [Helianthus annuus]
MEDSTTQPHKNTNEAKCYLSHSTSRKNAFYETWRRTILNIQETIFAIFGVLLRK